MHGDRFSDLGIPRDATKRSIRPALRQTFIQCHPDKNEGKMETVPVNYIQSLNILSAQLGIPTNYFIILELHAAWLTHGIPPPRILYRPNGTRMTLPLVNFGERSEMFAESRIHGEPDAYLPPVVFAASLLRLSVACFSFVLRWGFAWASPLRCFDLACASLWASPGFAWASSRPRLGLLSSPRKPRLAGCPPLLRLSFACAQTRRRGGLAGTLPQERRLLCPRACRDAKVEGLFPILSVRSAHACPSQLNRASRRPQISLAP